MRARLIGQQIGNEISFYHFREDVGAIANQTYRDCALCLSRLIDQLQCLIERFRYVVAISVSEPLLDPHRIYFVPDEAFDIHDVSQRVGAAHSTDSAAHDE